MEKEFVPYEEALELKELGFDEPCFGFYTYEGKFSNELSFNEYKNTALKTSAPLYQQAFRWFRDKHMLKGEVTHADSSGSSKFTIWKWNFDNNIGKWERIPNIGVFNKWEEAELACLKKLIEIVKEKK